MRTDFYFFIDHKFVMNNNYYYVTIAAVWQCDIRFLG